MPLTFAADELVASVDDAPAFFECRVSARGVEILESLDQIFAALAEAKRDGLSQ